MARQKPSPWGNPEAAQRVQEQRELWNQAEIDIPVSYLNEAIGKADLAFGMLILKSRENDIFSAPLDKVIAAQRSLHQAVSDLKEIRPRP